MGPCGHKSLVVTEDQDPVIHPLLFHPANKRLHDQAVQLVDGQQLIGQAAVVGGFIGRFQMETHKRIAGQQGILGCLQLTCIVGVYLAGGAFHGDHFQANQNADAVYQRHSADDRTAMAVILHKVGELDGSTFRPEPNTVGRFLTGSPALIVQRQMLQLLVGKCHRKLILKVGDSSQALDDSCCLSFLQVVSQQSVPAVNNDVIHALNDTGYHFNSFLNRERRSFLGIERNEDNNLLKQ